MAAVQEMHQLVDDDIVDEPHRGLYDAPVQPNRATVVAASPAFLLVRDDDPGHWSTHLRSPCLHPFREPFGGLTAEPRHQSGSHMGGLLRFPQHGHVQPSAAQLCLAGRVRIDLQAVVPPQVQDTLPADELARRSARSLAFRTPEAFSTTGTGRSAICSGPCNNAGSI